jgi:hypothetical protein
MVRDMEVCAALTRTNPRDFESIETVLALVLAAQFISIRDTSIVAIPTNRR